MAVHSSLLSLLTLLIVLTPVLSTKVTGNRSDQDGVAMEEDCSIQSCKSDVIAATFAENSSRIVTVTARTEYNESSSSFNLKFEHKNDNSATKEMDFTFDVKLLTMDEKADQKCRLLACYFVGEVVCIDTLHTIV